MSRRMSVSMTLDAVRDRTKTVTRRHVDTWKDLAAADRLTLIEKGMGLPKGAKQVVVSEVEVVAVNVEPLARITTGDVDREGLAHRAHAEAPGISAREWFIRFWLAGHGYPADADPELVECRRIEWRYLAAPEALS